MPRRRLSVLGGFSNAKAESMTVNRFEDILRYLHFADNFKLQEVDKFAKMRPLFNMLNDKYIEFWVEEKCLNVDESMAPYYGQRTKTL